DHEAGREAGEKAGGGERCAGVRFEPRADAADQRGCLLRYGRGGNGGSCRCGDEVGDESSDGAVGAGGFYRAGCLRGCHARPRGAPPSPVPSDSWNGTVGHVLISDRGADQDGVVDYLSVGFNSSKNWQDFLTLRQQGHLAWIRGQVVVADRSRLYRRRISHCWRMDKLDM